MSPMPNGGASLGVCGGSVWCIGACFYLYLKHIPLFYFMFFPLSLIKRRIWTNHVHEVCVFNSTVTWQAISCSCFAAWCRKQFYWDFRWRLLRYMMKSTCCRVRGPNSYRRKHFCFATEGTIFITCNSVSSPNGKWFTSLGTGHQSSCHSDARVVKSTGGGGGSGLSLCFPLNSWPQRWLMDSCVLWYIFFYKDRQKGTIRKMARVVSNLSCGKMKDVGVCDKVGGHKHQPYQIQLSFWHQSSWLMQWNVISDTLT